MRSFRYDRRRFLALSSAALTGTIASAQGPSLAHTSVADLERSRVLSEAKSALAVPAAPVTAIPAPHGGANQFFSEIEPDPRTAGTLPLPRLFRAHAQALRELSATVACLCAAYLLTGEAPYASRAVEHVRANLLTPATRLEPSFDTSGCKAETTTGTPAGIVDLVPLAEFARALSFLVDSGTLSDGDWDAVHAWFKSAHEWLTGTRAPVIARDTKDHRASAWLLVAAAIARFNLDDAALEAHRKRLRSPTLRNQIRSDGIFPQEVATPNPFRNTLFNFDLLTGACQLLSSPFDQLWTYELLDGVGLRIVAAYLFPVIAHPEHWGFVADVSGFRELPGRRPGLLFAGRAYDRPEYVEVWRSLPAGPPPADIAESFPIRQPLLWTARAAHGL